MKLVISKVIAGIVLAATVGVGYVAVDQYMNNNEKQELVADNEVLEEEVQGEEVGLSSEEILAEYREIMDVYHTATVEKQMYGEEMGAYMMEQLKEYGVKLGNGCIADRYEQVDKLYYGLLDLNKDGKNEMIISMRHPQDIVSGNGDNVAEIYADVLWGTYNGKVEFMVDREWGILTLYNSGNYSSDFLGSEDAVYITLVNAMGDGSYRSVLELNELNMQVDGEMYDPDNEYEHVNLGTIEKENGGIYPMFNVEWYEFNGLENEDNKIELKL